MRLSVVIASLGGFTLIAAIHAAEASEPKAFYLIDSPASSRPACQSGSNCCSATPNTVAAGIVADGTADVLVAVQTQAQPTSATITITNEATLVPYDPNIHTYPPKAGSTTLTVSGSQIVEYEPGVYILANAQAPDILKPGADGGYTNYSQPIVTTVTGPEIPTQTTQLQVYPPPVLFLHGLLGSETSLAGVANYLSGMAPWQGLPANFLTRFQYQNDAAFDATVISNAVSKQVNMIASALTNDQIAVGRIDIVAHSMGGLVARHYTSVSGYNVSSSRTLGLFPTAPDGGQESQSAEPSGPMPVLRQVKPLLITPVSGIMGEDISFSLKVPFEQVVEVSENQLMNGRGYDNDVARISRAADGTTRVTVTPLLTGRVQFDIVTTMNNHEFAAQSVYLNVGLPTRPPLQFSADQTCEAAASKACVSHMHVGTEYNLWPLLVLRAAPAKKLSVGQFTSYTAIQDAAHPVIALEQDGSYKALREGTATIVVSYCGYQASLEVVVNQSFPLMIESSR